MPAARLACESHPLAPVRRGASASSFTGAISILYRRLVLVNDAMDPHELDALLHGVRDGRVTPDEAVERLKTLPFENLGFATVDHHRALRRGFGEVIFGAGKTPEQVAAIVDSIASRGQNVLVTRAAKDDLRARRRRPAGRTGHVSRGGASRVPWCRSLPARLDGSVAVVCAGTSDVPVAEEAALTAEFHGACVERVYDVGVAGLHRLLDRAPVIRRATVVIVAAGMEGALPSVVGGLVEAPVIAVPTSVGYGAVLPRPGRPARDAELLRLRGCRRQHRQRLRSRATWPARSCARPGGRPRRCQKPRNCCRQRLFRLDHLDKTVTDSHLLLSPALAPGQADGG